MLPGTCKCSKRRRSLNAKCPIRMNGRAKTRARIWAWEYLRGGELPVGPLWPFKSTPASHGLHLSLHARVVYRSGAPDGFSTFQECSSSREQIHMKVQHIGLERRHQWSRSNVASSAHAVNAGCGCTASPDISTARVFVKDKVEESVHTVTIERSLYTHSRL